jgi:hypothetical protein
MESSTALSLLKHSQSRFKQVDTIPLDYGIILRESLAWNSLCWFG